MIGVLSDQMGLPRTLALLVLALACVLLAVWGALRIVIWATEHGLFPVPN